jgi:exopolysaccharide biosynthesis protein
LLFVVDGRQPNYSEGMSLPELAQVMLDYGADTALNLDGGGSSTLVMEGNDGKPHVLNSPIHGRVPPGRERPVANHLGIFAKRIEN